ncbi:MAG TPA: cupin domain-containing protein [Candidatus Acidoferrales bacterium]|nr:cupin domain-containing protein [Candidatus Acidoferrales bacterium]
MPVYHQEQNVEHELQGNHMTGLATASRGAQSTEMWRAKMDAGAATPPHVHEHEEVLLILAGQGRATIGDEEVCYRAGDTVILPSGKVHQIFAETSTDIVSAMALGGTVRLPNGELLDLPWRK